MIRFSLEYALSIVIVFRRIKSFCLRRLTAFNIQRSRRRKTTPYEETVDFFGCMVEKGKHKAMKYKAGTLKSITNTFFLPLLTEILNLERLPQTGAKN